MAFCRKGGARSRRHRGSKDALDLPLGGRCVELIDLFVCWCVCVCVCVICVYYTVPVAPVAQRYPCNLLTRWDVSSIPADGIFLAKKLKTKTKNAQRVENDQIVSTQNST